MSAGGLSYSCLKNSAKVTLPSVEMWGESMNVLRDPPKGIHTRRIDKVGQTQSILNAQDESGDRISEYVQPFARGINPMVAVSFDNYSNNGGRSTPFQHNKAVSLPYKVQTVRPPIQRQEDLLPLSRLPRNWFYAYTNKNALGVVEAAQCTETGKSVRSDILHPQATANKTINAVGHVPRDAPSRTVLETVPHMQTDARVFLPQQTYGYDYDTGAEKKSIQDNKMDVVAITNKSSGDGSRQSEFDVLSAGRVGEILSLDVGSNKSSNQQSYDQTANFIAKDPKQIHWNKKVYEAFTQKSFKKDTAQPMDNTNKFINKDKYLCIARTNKSTKEHFVQQDVDVSVIPTKDYLYNNVKTQSTSVFQIPQQQPQSPPTNGLKELITMPVATQKNFLTKDQEQGLLSHSIQESLLSQADTTKSFIASKNALDNSVYQIHNEKRTPLHSMQTNTQTPYSMPLMPETVLEQRRSHPLMEAQTFETDPIQLQATRNAYHVQSRDGNHKTQASLPKGGFEGQGNAVPVFNQYENYEYAISDAQRQDLRQRTISIMEERNEPPPVFA